jgi:DNA-binding MarR family transcriptional regulator
MHFTVNSFAREVGKIFDEYVKPLGIAPSYGELLMLLDKNEGMQQQEIADEMNLAPSTITRFIAKLEKEKLVEKQKKEGRSEVILTKMGVKKTVQIKKEYSKAVTELEQLLGEKFVTTTEQLLKHGAEQLKERES